MARPLLKRGVWYYRYRHHRNGWTMERMAPARTAQAPDGVGKREAERLNAEKQLQHNQVRHGHAPPPNQNLEATFAALCQWYIDHRMKPASRERSAGGLRKHLIDWDGAEALGPLPPAQVTSGKVENFLYAKEKELGPASLNNLRSQIRAMFNAARKSERFFGPNPVTKGSVSVRTVPQREHEYYKAEWVPRILAAIESRRLRNLVAVAYYQGLRKGELFGLEKTSVHLDTGMIEVRRSHDATTTKGKKAKSIPIHPEAVPYLLEAMASSEGELVFVQDNGRHYRRDYKMSAVMRAAMCRAGVGITGYSHTCHGCGHTESSKDGLQRYCPASACATKHGRGRKLYPHTHVVPLTFHSTRHTTATLLAQAGAGLLAIQRYLRHSDLKVTEGYMHHSPGWMQSEIKLLTFPAQEEQARAVAGGFDTPLLPEDAPPPIRPDEGVRDSLENPAVAERARRESNPQPSASKADGTGLPRDIRRSQAVVTLSDTQTARTQALVSNASVLREFDTRLLPARDDRRRLQVVPERWLTVRDVAAALTVCTATVYRLVDLGELPHIRVLGAIRVAPGDLKTFLAQRKRSG